MTSLGKSVAVVGAGPGLGAALADAFADTGYQVAMLARDAERLATLASAAKSHLTAIACDATDPEAVANAFNQIEVDLGPLDCVIFNAGTFRPGGVLDTTPEDFEMCRSEEHTSELQSLMRISYAVFCLQKKTQ